MPLQQTCRGRRCYCKRRRQRHRHGCAQGRTGGRRHNRCVLGCGIDIAYPAANKNLFAQICERGALVTEYPPGTPPAAYNFPARNRIINGMTHGILVAEAAKKAIAVEEGNAMAHYLLGKADNGQNDGIMCIAHLTKAIVLKDDFTEARLLRAEALTKMQQYKEAMEDIDAILAQDPDDENAILLRGKIKEATGAEAEAEADYLHITELNPFNEQAFLYLGQLYIVQKKADRSHRFV